MEIRAYPGSQDGSRAALIRRSDASRTAVSPDSLVAVGPVADKTLELVLENLP